MYSGLNDPARWVLPLALAEQAERQPASPWFVGVGGETLSFRQAHDEARRVAAFLLDLGVQRGDTVALLAGNHADFVRAWLGIQWAGAVAVLLNTELRGAFLRHQLLNSNARLAIVDADLVGAVAEVGADVPALTELLVIGAMPSAAGALPRQRPWRDWQRAAPRELAAPGARDIACVMYTSGTSGPSKGVLMPQAHCALYGIGALEAFAVTPQDRYYVVLPLYHANGLLMQLGATLLAGIAAVVRPRFSGSEWLNDLRAHRATITNCLGALAAFVCGQPATPHDRDHALRALLNGPNLPQFEQQFRERFGIADVISGYGMTEVNIPVWGRVGRSTPGACGWVSSHFELIVADPETDVEMPRGQIGEILVRPRVPFAFMQGYLGMPERTVEAWRNLWFHSGDAATMDADGLVTFVDRLKDCIRRRGENIAATEVEAQLAVLPGVAELAAYAVPSDIPGGEDELMLAVVAAPDAALDLHRLGELAERMLPRFARPRYLERVPELPKTATGKVQRAVLRKRGTATALDRGAGERRPREKS